MIINVNCWEKKKCKVEIKIFWSVEEREGANDV
jgi:hypothetical protein